MQWSVVSVGDKPAQWASLACEHYLTLINRYVPCKNIELKSAKLSAKQNATDVKRKEAKIILDTLPQQTTIIALDERGKEFSSQDFALKLERWQSTQHLAFIIGGTEGLDDSIKEKAQLTWALSKLTLPHQLAKMMCLEQLFRGLSILNNHPYHR